MDWPAFTYHYLKNIEGREYWYLQKSVKINRKRRIIAAYVAPKDTPEEELQKAAKVASLKLLNRMYELTYNVRKRKFKAEYLEPYQIELLEKLRFDYNNRFREVYPDAYKMYKNAAYIRYVHGTTAIEGNTYSLSETKQVLEDELTVSGKSLREQHEIENYKRLRTFVENYNKKFGSPFIRKVHQVVCANIPNCDPGEWRNGPVVITGTNIEPPQAAAIPFEIESLITWFNKKISANYHVLEVACEFHQRFEELHPFRNGNGRVGRELINYFLERFEYPPVYLEKEDRENYLSALAAGNDDKLKPLVNLFFNKLMTNHAKFLEQVKETTETAKKFTPSIQTKLEDFIPRGEKDE